MRAPPPTIANRWGGTRAGTNARHPTQPARDVGSALPARFWIFGKAVMDHMIESRWSHGLDFRNQFRILFQNRAHHTQLRLTFKGALPRDHFVKRAAEAEN